MNRRLPTSLMKDFLIPSFSKLKNNFAFKKVIFVFILLFGLVPSLLHSQGTSCANATSITVNGNCLSSNSLNGVDSGPAATNCGTSGNNNNLKDIGWYKFTVSGGPLEITVTAEATRNLAFQLISSTSNCAGLNVIDCVNKESGTGGGNAVETTTQTLSNGTYYIKIYNVGAATMTLTSLCVSAPLTPSISSFTPNSACASLSQTVVITGTNFTGATAVTIGGTAAASFVVNSATQITATVGSGTTGVIKVTTAAGTATSTGTFTVNPLPATTTVSGGGTFCGSAIITASGGSGGTIYFQGTSSGGTSTTNGSSPQTVTSSGTYYFRSRSASGCWGSEGSVVVTITTPVTPTATTSAATAITVSGATLNASSATFGVCPNTTAKGFVISRTIDNATPTIGGSGVANQNVTLGTAGAFSQAVTGLVPSTQYSYRAYLYDGFTYTYGPVSTFTTLSPPTISSFTPASGCASSGVTVVITGTGFSGATAVTFGGTAAVAFTVNSTTQITATVGSGTTGKIAVTTGNGTATSASNFTVNPLPVISAQPVATTICTTGSGSFSVTASGATTYQWRRGGVNLTNIAPYSGVNSPTLTITNPTAAAAGNFDVIVSNSNCSVTSAQRTLTITTVPGTVVNPFPTDGATAVCYSGLSPVSSISWTATATATSYDVYFGAGSLPSTYTNVASNSFPAGALAANTTYYWRVVARNSCGAAVTSNTFSFTTSNYPCYCAPTTATPQNTFIKNVRFLGTLNDVSNDDTGYTNGYQDFTGLTNKTSQVAGEGINIYVESNDVDAIFKAWVDWNNDGSFNNTKPVTATSELVFTSGGTRAISTTFGIVIPAGTPPGDYRIRIKNYRNSNNATPPVYSGDDNYGSCDNLTGRNYGETEDYIIKVLSNCSANIVAPIYDVENCGPGMLTLNAKANIGTTSIRWYDSLTGGNMVAETPVSGPNYTGSYTTSTLNTTKTYYVTAWNGTCESIFRTPIVAKIKPLPNLSFDVPGGDPNFCGDNNTLKLIPTGGNELVYLIDETFSTGLGVFNVRKGTSTDSPPSGNDNSTASLTGWQNQASTFKPIGAIWSPAISSGFGGNTFAYATSDYSNKTIHTILTTASSYDTTDFLNLNLSFSVYYSYYGDTSAAAGGTVEGLFVEVSSDGTNWTRVQAYFQSLGLGTKFQTMTINLDSYRNITNLQIRFRYLAYWGDGIAIDNVKLYGDRPLRTSFTWSSTPNIGIYLADCITPYVNGTKTSSVICIKPSDPEIETIKSWNVTAIAKLTNNCNSSGVINIRNDNKVWNVSSIDWNNSANQWKPDATLPDINKCVIIKQPVVLNLGADGAAKNVTVEAGGSLQIMAPRTLKIDDYLKNNTTADKINLESDANLLQNNPTAANVGGITAKRTVTGLRNDPATFIDYVYWGSPVFGQQTKGPGGFSPLTPKNRFYSYRESNDKFYETADFTFTSGRGYAVQAEAGIPNIKTYTFQGAPNNGDISFNIIRSPNTPNSVKPAEPYVHGYNMVANPYPSNISFEELYQGNSGLIYNTAWFWTNHIFEKYQKGSKYNGNNYAVINGTGGVASTYSTYASTGGTLIPDGIVKVGQGFIVQKKDLGTGSLIFKNSYGTGHDLRTGTAGTIFFQKGAVQKNRFWLTLTNPDGVVNSQLIGYVAGATDAFEQDFDSEAFDNYSDLFYSDLAGKKLVIMGKSDNFSADDKINLGANFSVSNSYTIALDKAEGIFQTDQNIYLKDKETGTVTDLSNQSYTFPATQGLSENRFEIIYKPEQTLSTGDVTAENLWVYREADQFVIKSSNKITDVELYDASGRLIIKLSPNATQTKISGDKLVSGVFVLKIKLLSGEVVTRKIRK